MPVLSLRVLVVKEGGRRSIERGIYKEEMTSIAGINHLLFGERVKTRAKRQVYQLIALTL